jgi:hypothetical protein
MAKKTSKPSVIPTVTLPRQGQQTSKKPVKAKVKAQKISKKPGKSKRATRSQPQVTTGAPPVGSTPPPMESTRPSPKTSPKRAEHSPVTDAPPVPPTAGAAEQDTEPVAAPAPAIVDGRMVQGSQCTWIGRMDQAVDDSEGIPKCPCCGNNLLTAQDEETIQLGLEAYELGAYQSVNPAPRAHPGYGALMAWMRGSSKRCWPTIEQAADSFYKETGRLVIPGR